MVILNSITAFSSLISTQESYGRIEDGNSAFLIAKNTHLHLEHRGISEIGEMCRCPKLTVLYLYDNKLEKIRNLDFCPALTHLYLQNNRLRRIENLHDLPHLQKLFLSNNHISILEGLENNSKLEELHIDHQILGEGENFDISPAMAALSHSLTFLDVAGNSMINSVNLQLLTELTCLRAGHNSFSMMEPLLLLLQRLPHLVEANFSGNPVAKTIRYREMLIMANPNVRKSRTRKDCANIISIANGRSTNLEKMLLRVEHLDGKEVSNTSRQFLFRMKESRSRASMSSRLDRRQTASSATTLSYASTAPPIENSGTNSQLQSSLKPVASHQSTSKYVLPGLVTTLPPQHDSSDSSRLLLQKGSTGFGDSPQYSSFATSDGSWTDAVPMRKATSAASGQPGRLNISCGNMPEAKPPAEMNEALAHKHSLGEEMFPPQNWNIL